MVVSGTKIKALKTGRWRKVGYLFLDINFGLVRGAGIIGNLQFFEHAQTKGIVGRLTRQTKKGEGEELKKRRKQKGKKEQGGKTG